MFTVTSTADAGPASLRQAILDANAGPSADEIRFDLPGLGGTVRTIRPVSPLPAGTGPVTVDGTTQPGYAGTPLVELDGSAAGATADGLVLGGLSVVRGLAVNRFSRNGIVLAGPNGRIEANSVGTTAAGDAAAGNGGTGVLVTGAGATVGGTTASARNVISGNGSTGVWVAAPGVRILGNYIGTDAAGARSLGNGREGVFVAERVSEVVVGGPAAGAGNLVSGNLASGIRVARSAGAVIQGNLIGVDALGARAVANGLSPASAFRDGITADEASTVTIGGGESGARNVISGNLGAGIDLVGARATVRGNHIGTDATGHAAIGNASDGVFLSNLPTDTSSAFETRYVVANLISGNGRNGVLMLVATSARGRLAVNGNFIGTNATGSAAVGNGGAGVLVVGGNAAVGAATLGVPSDPAPAPSGCNVISGNAGHGIHAVNAFLTVRNNHVGTDAMGGAALGNGGHGVLVEQSSAVIGTGTGQRGSGGIGNLISANRGNGVTILGAAGYPWPSGSEVRSNRVGTDASGGPGNGTLGNLGHGVGVINSADVSVGAEQDSGNIPAGNTIAFNGGSGVYVDGPDPSFSSGSGRTMRVRIVRNSIFSNGRLGIDLVGNDAADGVTRNDPGDADRGPNTLLNYPVITAASARPDPGGFTTVRAAVVPGAAERVDFYASPVADPSGFGEGQTYLGSAPVPPATSPTPFVIAQFPVAVPVGWYVTATATTRGRDV